MTRRASVGAGCQCPRVRQRGTVTGRHRANRRNRPPCVIFSGIEGLRGIRHSTSRTAESIDRDRSAASRPSPSRPTSARDLASRLRPLQAALRAPAVACRRPRRHDPRGQCDPRSRARRRGRSSRRSRTGCPFPAGSCWPSTTAGDVRSMARARARRRRSSRRRRAWAHWVMRHRRGVHSPNRRRGSAVRRTRPPAPRPWRFRSSAAAGRSARWSASIARPSSRRAEVRAARRWPRCSRRSSREPSRSITRCACSAPRRCRSPTT